MDKHHILREIRRIAAANCEKAPGTQVFERETGIRKAEWYPDLWLRWSDALAEAGYAPNLFQARLGDSFLVKKYIGLVRELGRLPVEGEIRRKAKTDKSFPSHTVFSRFGGKRGLLDAVISFCQSTPGHDDVLQLCERHVHPSRGTTEPRVVTGFVYLMKSGRHYKIGRTNSVGRRESELGTKIPVPARTIHSIETDDPCGVEAYWHKRFSDKRGEGEWFLLSPGDVMAFKRWKRIV